MDVTEQPLGLLKVPAVAEILQLSEKTVWRLIYSEQLESVKSGRSRRVTKQAVAAYIASLTAPAASDQQEAS